MKATSTSAAGMVAPTSTLNGACFTPRLWMPVIRFISSCTACASRLDSLRYSCWARSQSISLRSLDAAGAAFFDAFSTSAAFSASLSDASSDRK